MGNGRSDPPVVPHHLDQVLGGVDRITFPMTNVALAHPQMLRGIELLGAEVVPHLR